MRVGKSPLAWDTVQSSSATYLSGGEPRTSGDLSNATLYSAPIRLDHISKYSIQLSVTGAGPTGSFVLQGSNSNPADTGTGMVPGGDASAMVWTPIAGSTATFTVADNHVWNADGVGYRWVRVVWAESGTATGTVVGEFVGKGES